MSMVGGEMKQLVRGRVLQTLLGLGAYGVAGLFLILGGCAAGDSGGGPTPPTPQASVTLIVAKAGNGAGTLTSTPAGVNCGAVCTLTVSSGTVVTLNGSPAPNNTLTDWGGTCTAGSATCAVTVTANQTVTVTFNTSTATPIVTATTAGTGGGSMTCSTNGGPAGPCGTFSWGDQISITANPNGSSFFAGWSGGCSGSASPCTIPQLTADTVVTATFTILPTNPQLSVTKNGTGSGTVISNLMGINCGGICSSTFAGGAVVRLTATPIAGSTFAGWTGGGCSGTGTCDVTMNANAAVTATFNIAPVNPSLVVTTSGTGTGAVTCNGAPCNSSYPSGTSLTIVATPAATSLFGGWGGACSGFGATSTCTVTLNADSTVSAAFQLPTLSVVLAGTGTVTSNPAGINCGATCSASFSKGTSVTLTATGTGFGGWSGEGCSGTGTCVIPLNQNATVSATFGVISTSARYHFFTMVGGGPLMAVDPAAPTAIPVTVASVVSQTIPLYSNTWDAGARTFINIQPRFQVYTSNGKLWRVNILKSSGVPGSPTNPPVQISSESAATTVCQLKVVDDGTSPNTRRVFYELAGADGICLNLGTGGDADNITKFVSLSDGSAVAPTVLPTGLTLSIDRQVVYDLSTGIATHLFLIDAANSNTLKIMNLSTQIVTSIQANIPGIALAAQDTSDRVFLQTVNSNGTSTVYIYTISLNTLVQLVSGVSFGGGESQDGTNFFASDRSAGIIYRIPFTATAAGQVTQLLNLGVALDNFVATTNRIYVTVPVLNGVRIISGLKSGGAFREDVPAAIGRITPQALGGLFYYTRSTMSSTLPLTVTSSTTVVLNENGTVVSTFANAGDAGVTLSVGSEKVLLSTYVGGVLNGGTMTAVDAATGAVAATIGTVPSTVPSLGTLLFIGAVDSASLGIGFPLAGATGSWQVFFLDSAIPNSLVQVPVGPGNWFMAQ